VAQQALDALGGGDGGDAGEVERDAARELVCPAALHRGEVDGRLVVVGELAGGGGRGGGVAVAEAEAREVDVVPVLYVVPGYDAEAGAEGQRGAERRLAYARVSQD
jgi:hypothetical protein